jgi:hypothetical protein
METSSCTTGRPKRKLTKIEIDFSIQNKPMMLFDACVSRETVAAFAFAFACLLACLDIV